jgi:O-antigen/teichoic acid export membrane protein
MVRFMSKDDIGVWTIYLSIPTVFELLRNGFIRNPLISHLVTAPTEDDRGRLITASWILHSVLVIFTSGILVIGAKYVADAYDSPQMIDLFYVYALRSLVLIPCLQFEYLQQSQANFKAIFLANIARLAPTAIYLLVKFIEHKFVHPVEVTLMDIAIVQLISAVVSLWVGYIYVRGTTIIYPKVDFGVMKMLSGFGKYTMGTTISSTVIKNTDTWMIGLYHSTIGVASYNPALRISNLIEVPTLAVASLVYPQVGRKMKESGHKGVQDVYVKSVSLILAMMLPGIIPLYFLSDFVIEIIFTSSYSDAAPILRVTLFFTLLIPFNRQFGTVMDALKRPKINFYLLVMMGVLNVGFCYFFLQSHGVIGAAYATLLSYCIIFLLNQFILFQSYGINTFKVFPAIIDWYRTGWNVFRTKILKIA